MDPAPTRSDRAPFLLKNCYGCATPAATAGESGQVLRAVGSRLVRRGQSPGVSQKSLLGRTTFRRRFEQEMDSEGKDATSSPSPPYPSRYLPLICTDADS